MKNKKTKTAPKKVAPKTSTGNAIEDLKKAGFSIEESQARQINNLLTDSNTTNVNEITAILCVDENENKEVIFAILEKYTDLIMNS